MSAQELEQDGASPKVRIDNLLESSLCYTPPKEQKEISTVMPSKPDSPFAKLIEEEHDPVVGERVPEPEKPEPKKRKSPVIIINDNDSDKDLLDMLSNKKPHLAGGGFLQGVAEGTREPTSGKKITAPTEESAGKLLISAATAKMQDIDPNLPDHPT